MFLHQVLFTISTTRTGELEIDSHFIMPIDLETRLSLCVFVNFALLYLIYRTLFLKYFDKMWYTEVFWSRDERLELARIEPLFRPLSI